MSHHLLLLVPLTSFHHPTKVTPSLVGSGNSMGAIDKYRMEERESLEILSMLNQVMHFIDVLG